MFIFFKKFLYLLIIISIFHIYIFHIYIFIFYIYICKKSGQCSTLVPIYHKQYTSTFACFTSVSSTADLLKYFDSQVHITKKRFPSAIVRRGNDAARITLTKRHAKTWVVAGDQVGHPSVFTKKVWYPTHWIDWYSQNICNYTRTRGVKGILFCKM